jgi:formylglycine-generating enzyme required for sulfatase activity
MNAPRPALLSFLRSLIVALMCGGAVASVQADPAVSNLTASQRAGTKLVDITYDLDAPGFGLVAVTLEASSDGGATWTVPVISVTGAVGGSVVPGTGKAIVWNAGVDWAGNYSTQMRFRVVAEDGFSYIPGGSFTMGRTSGDTNADAPPITVTVGSFYLQERETTKAQWDEVRTWAVNNGYTDLAVGAGKAANHPVQTVSWWDVVKWCNARSEKEGLTPVYTVSGAVMRTGTTEPIPNWSANGYRLPTEAEWEKAARGGVSGKRFPWGTDTISHSNANYYGSSSPAYDLSPINNYHPSYTAGGTPYTSPVGSFGANGYGLYDMSGNVWEWCWDWYGSSYYATSNGTTDPRGPASGTYRVYRGGSWSGSAFSAHCAYRNGSSPGNTFNYFGFRPARTHLVENMSLIPGGSFTMGVTSGDTDSDAPSITVTVGSFYLQERETTKAQWDEVRAWAVNNGYTDLAVGGGKASNHPVHSVSWWDAVKWCNARSEKEGLTPVYTVGGAVMRSGTTEPVANWTENGYRLPTEAEWEKAARGGVEGKRFPWGTDTISHVEANYRVYSSNGTTNEYTYDVEPRPPATGTYYNHPSYTTGATPYTSPVGSFGANGYGLYDMAGNVWEWCWDWYGASFYTTSNGTTDPRGLASGTNRVFRGGGWGGSGSALNARCSFRGSSTPGESFQGSGFRTARTHLVEDMSLIPGGTFTMGVTSGDADVNAPSITVTVSPFYIQQTETTKAQWDEVRAWAVNNGYTDLAAGSGKASNHPVHSVSWWDVVKWCNARSEKEGLTPVYTVSGIVMRTGTTEPVPNWSANGYRLPTEAEWEKAARGGVSGKRFPWGTDTISHAQANYYGSSAYAYDQSPINDYHPSYTPGGMPYTSQVGSFGANGYGLYDMSGNVWEWCSDWHGPSYYILSAGTTDPPGPGSGSNRVIRGGGWNDSALRLRCADRYDGATPGSMFQNIGFRPVRSAVGIGIPQTSSITLNTRDNPSVNTPTATGITSTVATLGGNVTADGGSTITERGVVYSATSTTNDPLINGTGVTKVTATGTTGVFNIPITGLTPGTNHSYKAYATNSQGTTYTSVATFTTLSNNADLSALTLSSGTLSPTFASATTSYTASVSNATTSITVTPTRAQANATIEARVNTGTYAAVTSGSPSASLSLNVGSNTVDVRVTAQDGTTQKTYTVTVTRMATQSITFANPGAQLANATVNLSATGGGSGNPVTFTVEGPAALGVGNVLSFTGAGSVTVRANQDGNDLYHPAPEVAQTFTVTKATATVTLGNLSQTYDGAPKSATATTDPVGKTVTFTYEGSATAPTNAGSYAVVGTIDDGIYQGSANGTLTIAKAAQTITFFHPGPQLANATMDLSATGGGSGNPVTFAVTSGPASISNGVLSFTGPGNVTITASQAGNANYEAASPVSRTFTVSKAAATITLSRLHQVADGTAREVVVTTVPVDLEIEVTYDGTASAPIAPGSYSVVATSADDRYEGSASGTFVVDDPARSVRVPGGSLSALGDLTVPTFSIGAYEVTGSQWATVVTWAEANAGYDFAGAGAAASGDRPVTGISWFDAAKWCNARTEWENALLARSLAPAYRVAGAVFKTGTPTLPASVICDFSAGGYRLPTAAEWEYAARGGAFGTPSTYPGGNTLDDLGWYVGNSNGATQPAGGKTANGLSLYDLAGNAAEWTWDAPTGSPGRRLLQGGAWSSTASACELSSFSSETASTRLDRSGFRVARSISLALAAALDAPNLSWESGGDEAWFAQTTPSHDGIDAAESGSVAPGQSSWLETTVTGPANLRFRWEASQRGALDLFRLETRTGDPILLTGAANWSERLVELPEGDHTLRWLFVRDAASTGISRVRLDAVSVTPATTPTVTTAAAASISGSGATLGGEVTADGGRTVTARGVVYATTPEPTLTSPGALAAASGGTGTFSVTATGLTEGTTYFARAYATNNLGTAYGSEIVLTTDTTVPLTNGFGAVIDRSILAGDTQRFRLSLAFPSDAAFASAGLNAATWELRDGNGGLVDSGSGNVDFGGLLLSGDYLLSLNSTGDDPQTFSLELDASIEARPRPDLSIGLTASAATGAGVYSPTAQSVTVLSRRGVAKTVFARIDNDGLLPDAMRLRGSARNSLFAVSYFSGGGNVTAQMIAGTFATAVMGPDDAPIGLSVTITPNKRLVTRQVRQGGRLVTTYLRKTYAGFIEARAAGNTALSDAVRYQVTTTP